MQKRILTGIKPTSYQLHLGNYFGAVKPLFSLVENYPDSEVFFMIATMHALTTLHDPEALRTNVLNLAKLYLAMMRTAGVADEKLIIFNQPDADGHANMSWILGCVTHMGFMERMHAYKDALAKDTASKVSVGTFCYPILQAVDVLAYDSSVVPVGKDQKQHIEYARDIAQKFNTIFGDTFVLPEPLVQKNVAIVPGIDGRKMSKSYNNYIGLLDDRDTLTKKIKRIPTAAIGIDEPKNPDEDNIYKLATLFLDEQGDRALRQQYEQGGLSYKVAKEQLIETVWSFIEPLQQAYNKVTDNEVIDLLNRNGKYAKDIVQKKCADVYQKVGFSL